MNKVKRVTNIKVLQKEQSRHNNFYMQWVSVGGCAILHVYYHMYVILSKQEAESGLGLDPLKLSVEIQQRLLE